MALSTGIAAQKSRFAILDIESDSASSGDEWQEVRSTHGTAAVHKLNKGSHHQQGPSTGDRPLSKSAKKRARKRRNRNSSSSEQVTEKQNEGSSALTSPTSTEGQPIPRPHGAEWEEEMKRRNDEASDLEFHRQLQQALMISKLEAEQQSERMKQIKIAEQQQLQAKPTKAIKKGVTLSLQQLHSSTGPLHVKAHNVKVPSTTVDISSQLSDFNDSPVLSPDSPSMSHDQFTKSHNKPLQSHNQPSKSHDQPLKSPDSLFFDRLDEDIKSELKKEKKKPERQINGLTSPDAAEAPRIAHLQDEIEKRDKAFERLRRENATLKESLREVKERNQSLCKIMGQGEFSDKASLLQQIEELTSTKNDLTEEIGSLQVSLEQERSKNKTLKNDLAKLQNTKASKSTSTKI